MLIFTSLKSKHLIWIAILSLVFMVSQIYLMWTLPGYRDLMCVPHGYFTLGNIVYAIIISFFLSVLFVTILRGRIKRKFIAESGLGGIGIIIVSLTTFCTACTIPVITIFGLSFGIGFFSFYNLWFKIISFILVILGLLLAERKLRRGCGI